MGANHPIVKIGDVASSISVPHKLNKDQLIFLNTSDVLHGKILHRNYTNVKYWPGQAKKSIRTNDILYSEIRPANGRWAYVAEPADDFVVSTKLMVIRSKEDLIYPKYLYQFLTNNETAKWLQHLAESRSGTFPQITFDQVAALEIPLPPITEQRKIADILGTLDDKIELNRRMNATLEDMARTLFKSWFVDFDPVRAKMKGRQPEGIDAEMAALFPDGFEDSELGEVPRGWDFAVLKDNFNLLMGQSPPGDTYNEEGIGIPFYQGRTDFGFRFPKRRMYCTAPTRLAKVGDTLVSVRAPVGDINIADEECCIGRGVAAVRHKSDSISFTYHAMATLYPDFASFEAEGTVFGSINKQSFENLRCINPPPRIISAFEAVVSPMDDKIRTLEQQSRTLATLRDTLLPKLMGGAIINEIHVRY